MFLNLDFFAQFSVCLSFQSHVHSVVYFVQKKKGQRSYYPLFCTVAQTGQVLAILHCSGNVHDSNGAEAFILQCIEEIRTVLPHTIIELRMDGAIEAIDQAA
jgi:hypothetical protein